MKIIHRGVLPESKVYEATCRNCGSVIQFERHEAGEQSGIRNEMLLKISCPVCHHDIWTDL